MIVIETPRLVLREWKDTDVEPFIEMNRDKRVMEFFPALLSPEESLAMIDRIRQSFSKNKFGLWAVERKDNHRFIGFTGLSVPRFQADFTPCIEIGWRLCFEHWEKGFATEAAAACLQYGFEELSLNEIYSFTSLLNIRSTNVMKKLEMQYVKNFEHPLIEEGNVLRTHGLFKIDRKLGSPEDQKNVSAI